MELDRRLLLEVARGRLAAPKRASGHRQGDRSSRALGAGSAFADHRRFVDGDGLRRVDWNAWGRLRTLLVRLMEEDRDQRVAIVLDASASMGFGDKLGHAGLLTGALVAMGLRHRDTVVLRVVSGDRVRERRGGGPSDLPKMLDLLERTEAGGRATLDRAAQVGTSRLDRAVLISDLWLEPEVAERALRGLRVASVRPVVLHVLGSDDLQPDLSSPQIIVDAETGEEQVIGGGAGDASAYAEAVAQWQDELQRVAGRVGVSWVPAPTHIDARILLREVLPRAGVVEAGVRA